MDFRLKNFSQTYNWKYSLAIIGALAFVIINLIQSYHYGRQLVIGYTTDTDLITQGIVVVKVRAGFPADEAGLREKDIIIAVDERPVKDLESYEQAVSARPPGQPLTFTVRRESGELRLTIAPRYRLSLATLLGSTALVFICLLVGMACYVKNPQDSRTRYALLIFLSMAVYNAQLNNLSIAVYDSQFVSYSSAETVFERVVSIANILIRALALGLLGAMPLFIPERKRIVDRYPGVLALVFAPAILLAGLSLTNYFSAAIKKLPFDTNYFQGIDHHLLHGLFIYSPLVLLHTFYYAPSAAVRRQAKTMIYGLACWALMSALLLFATRHMSRSVLEDPFYAHAIDALLPLTVFFTVYRHKLFDIDVLIRKSLIYTTVSTALLILYFSLVASVSFVFASLFDYEGSVLAVALSTLIVGFGFTPVRRYSQRLVDRMFFREKYDYLELINQVTLELTATLDLARITEVLAEKLYQGMKLKRLAVLIPDEQQTCYLVRCHQGSYPEDLHNHLILRGDHKLIATLATQRVPLDVHAIDRLALAGREAEAVEALNAELFVPIALRQLVAVLALGEKHSEAAFDEDDLNFLETVARQAAIVMENARLFELATYDGLTALMRRTAFDGVFEDEIRRCRRYGRSLSLLMLDIDHFKRFNDTYGHGVGDLVLKRVAQAIKEQLRSTDTPSRYGGEEFCVLLAETGTAAAQKVAENLRARVSALVVNTGTETVNITVSIGVFSGTGEELPELDEIYARADAALYQAKAAGRNRVCTFTPKTSAELV